jgi:hypothetical protein
MGLVPIQTCRDQCRQEIIAAAARAAFGDSDAEVDLNGAKVLLTKPNEAGFRSDRPRSWQADKRCDVRVQYFAPGSLAGKLSSEA